MKSSLAGATDANVPSARPVRAPATPVTDPRLSGQKFYAMAGRGARGRPVLRWTVRLRPGSDLRRAVRHQGEVLAQPAGDRSGDELGYPGRAVRRTCQRRTGRPDRPQAHSADRGHVIHPGLPHGGAGTRYGNPGRGAAGRRRRGRCGRVAAPLYAAELAPTALRGRFVSAYQLAITIGIFLAYLVDGWLSKSDAWRIMLGASAVPGPAAVRGGAGGAGITALADEDEPPGRRCRGTAQDPTWRRRQAAPRRHREGSARGGRPRLLARGLP